jgi:hypothetical protein
MVLNKLLTRTAQQGDVQNAGVNTKWTDALQSGINRFKGKMPSL